MKLTMAELTRLEGLATRSVARSLVLAELVAKVKIQRGRFYLFDADEYVMARITPLAGKTFLLEAPRGSGWTTEKSGTWRVVLNSLERDKLGTFHGLGALAVKGKDGDESAPQRLRVLGVPIAVIAEPRQWYSMHRTPQIIETDADRGRVLAHFKSLGMFGSFHGTCLYARVDGKWGCYTVKPSASGSLTSAEAWLVKRGWEDWG